jgi:hypothetical protein
MKRLKHLLTAIKIKPVICLLVGLMGLLYLGPAWGAGPAGLSLNLYLKPDGADRQIPLGTEIKMLMVVKNETDWPLITEREFSEKKFYMTLILIYTDPFDKVKVYTLAGEELHAMLSAFFVGGNPMVRSEILPQGWVKSITIEDLRQLFPILKSTPGSYVVKAELPFLKFQWGFELAPLGQLGAADHPDNFNGILVSNEIPIYVFPARGAKINVRVLDNSTAPAVPLPQLEIKVFLQAAIPDDYSLQDAFTNLDPVLAGTTNFDGNTTWQTGSRCLLNENYTIIAQYGGDYGEAAIARDTDAGWQDACSGFIEKQIVFGQAAQVPVDDLVTVSYGRVMYNRRTGEFAYTATIANNSNTDLEGPVWLVIANLVPTTAVVVNADGQLDEQPYIEVLGSGIAFKSGQTISRALIIKNPSRYRITFIDQVLAVIP